MNPIIKDDLQAMREAYLSDGKARVVRNALTNNAVTTISRVFEAQSANPNLFSINLKTMGAVNQKKSGRCWIFSALNVLREKIAAKYDMKEFELSQNYIAFYDKLEKTNYFLEALIAEKDSPLDSPVNRYLLHTGVHDGGQWHMFTSVVKKYGLCPKSAMPETYQSSNTRGMNGILNHRLKKFAADIRSHEESEIPALKKQALKECYGVLCSCFGVPPVSFTFEYEDKDGNYHAEYDVKPLDFLKNSLDMNLDDYVAIINGPTADKPFNHMYTVQYLGNVADGEPVRFLNLDIDAFKKLILAQLEDGEPVWFGCDCGKAGDRENGLWDDQAFDYEGTFDLDLSMTKAEMLDTGLSAMNHAMVFTGVNLREGRPDRWKIENSWGTDVANKGYFICSDSWFDRYMYEATVNIKYLSEEQKAALKEEPKVLAPWDPFGSLAD